MNRPSPLASAFPLSSRNQRLFGRGFRLASGVALAAAFVAPSARASVSLASGDPADAFDVTVLANGLQEPTDVAELPDGRVVITHRLGDVTVVEADGETQTEAGHIDVDPEFQEQGLDGVVADPNFATNNTLYFFASADMNIANKNKVYKITLGANSMLDAGRMAIIDNGLLGPLNHNGGGMQIYDGKLFLGVGDTGHNATPPTNRLGTCLNSPNGKILRVNLDGSIPDDNPLSSETMVTGCVSASGCANDWANSCGAWTQNLSMQAPDKRIFFWGFRNPYRFWIDPQTTRIWIGDVGETTNEEVSVSAPLNSEEAANGQHFGWPFREGNTNYSQAWQPSGACMGVSPARECIGPVYQYPHSNGNNCIIGGLIPDGCGWADPWKQRYFFGDNGSGRVWTLDVNEARDGVVADSRKDFATSSGIASFHMGKKGALYFVEAGGGVVSKITPKALDPGSCVPVGTGGAGGMSSGGSAGTDTGGGGNMSAGGSGGVSSSGTGNSTGGTGTSGTGGGSTTGGSGGTGGGTGGTASAGKGGTTSATGGTATTTGGTTATTGGTGTGGASAGTAGSATAGSGGSSDESSGCGCRVAGSGSNFAALGAVLGGLGLMRLRSRFSRRRKAG